MVVVFLLFFRFQKCGWVYIVYGGKSYRDGWNKFWYFYVDNIVFGETCFFVEFEYFIRMGIASFIEFFGV